MSHTTTPPEVLVEFLRLLNETLVSWEEERLAPVLRGSLLMRHWFGDSARPAADIDLECFERPRTQPPSEEEQEYMGNGHGPYGEYESLVDYGKAMCRYSAISSQYYHWSQGKKRPEVEFTETDVPEDGSSLWVYGTPGERYYAGWVWHGRGGLTGRLQIDIAQAGSYALGDIATAEVELAAPGGKAFRCQAYTPEMLLAAKLSWLLRSLRRRTRAEGDGAPVWSGEPKDLFDAHLLLTQADIRAGLFQKSLLAVGTEDELDWNGLDVLFDVRQANMAHEDFPNWEPFRQRHEHLITVGPAGMLRAVVDRLEPLLGDFYRPAERPFLRAINADPVDELAYLVYADWLEEHGEARATFLRLFATYYFRENELSGSELTQTRAALKAALGTTSSPWLQQLFGTPARLREIRQRIEGAPS